MIIYCMDPNKLNGYCRFMFSGVHGGCCEKKLDNFSGLCNEHKNQSITKKIEYDYVSYSIKNKITDIGEKPTKSAKIRAAKDIFNLLCKHKQYLYDHEKFRNVILGKIFEFNEVFDTTCYLEELFPFFKHPKQDQGDDTIFEICI